MPPARARLAQEEAKSEALNSKDKVNYLSTSKRRNGASTAINGSSSKDANLLTSTSTAATNGNSAQSGAEVRL